MFAEFAGPPAWGIVETIGGDVLAGVVTPIGNRANPLISVRVPEVGETPAFERVFPIARLHSITPTTQAEAEAAAQIIRAYALPPSVLALVDDAPPRTHGAADDFPF